MRVVPISSPMLPYLPYHWNQVLILISWVEWEVCNSSGVSNLHIYHFRHQCSNHLKKFLDYYFFFFLLETVHPLLILFERLYSLHILCLWKVNYCHILLFSCAIFIAQKRDG